MDCADAVRKDGRNFIDGLQRLTATCAVRPTCEKAFGSGRVEHGCNGSSGQIIGSDCRQWYDLLRRERGGGTALVDTTNLESNYPTNVVRRKDLVSMRLPHSYRGLVRAAGSTF